MSGIRATFALVLLTLVLGCSDAGTTNPWSAGSARRPRRVASGAGDRRRRGRAGCRWVRVKPIGRRTRSARATCSI